jgi:hypothetical protein
MKWIALAMGVFYVVASLLALRQLRIEWFLAKARAGTLDRRSSTESVRLAFITISACLYGAAGVMLLFRSQLAVWLLGSGLLIQAIYYAMFSHRLASEAGAGAEDNTRRIWTAGMISMAAFAFSAYAARLGVLT